jgi:AraC-like DNA-binding protein
MHAPGQEPPSIPELRSLALAALQHHARALRTGACPIAIAPVPASASAAPAPGWEHWHPWPELFLQLTGASRFKAPDGDLSLSAGHWLLFPPRSAHAEHLGCPRQQFSNLVFTLQGGRLAYHVATAVAGFEQPRVVQPDSLPTTEALLGQAALQGLSRSGGTGDEHARAGWLLAFCAWAIGILQGAPSPGFSGSERVRRVRELITARLGSAELSVSQLGAWVGCHPDHLARLFRRETGETLVGHLRRRRLERARELLADPELRIADVARLVGLPDPAYFSRVFRRDQGQAPSVARGIPPLR